jgi:ketosteroid isomerase-like protein
MSPTTAPSNAATVRSFYELFIEGRTDDACRLLHDDFVVREPPGLPYSGEHHGADGFLELMRQIGESMEVGFEAVEFVEGGDKVLTLLTCRFASRSSGESVVTKIIEVFTLRAGRISEMEVFYQDAAAIARLLHGEELQR